MKVFLSSSGGLGAFRIQGEIDTAELSADLAQKAEDILQQYRKKPTTAPGNPLLVDGKQFSIRVSSGDESWKLELDQQDAPEDLFNVCEKLLNEVVNKRAKEIEALRKKNSESGQSDP